MMIEKVLHVILISCVTKIISQDEKKKIKLKIDQKKRQIAKYALHRNRLLSSNSVLYFRNVHIGKKRRINGYILKKKYLFLI